MLVWLVTCPLVYAQPLQKTDDDIPPLAPPLPEMQPTFWEQHAVLVVVLAVAAVALVGFALWLLSRPKPQPPVPPEVRVRAELEALRGGPETGDVLSRVSQSLRCYLNAAFGLPAEELTTTEFCRQLEASPTVGVELAATVSQFLREGDERKFSPTPTAGPLSAVRRALELVAQAEVRRREPRASVPESGCPPPLSESAGGSQERQRAGAPQHADANPKPPTP